MALISRKASETNRFVSFTRGDIISTSLRKWTGLEKMMEGFSDIAIVQGTNIGK
jgi:hypothetical protein